jgi:glucokinase
MKTLVADVGGTQSRLGLAQNGILDQSSVRRFENAKFRSFYEVVDEYLGNLPQTHVVSCVVALAGPIVAGIGTLTNLDWEVSVESLRKSMRCQQAVLMNDLTSLGYSLRQLPANGIQHISGPVKAPVDNGQHLIVGLGTGFNVCPVVEDGNGDPVCLQVELGHTSLAHNIKTALNRHIDSSAFNTVEDIFSGKGLSNLYQAVSGGGAKSGETIVQEHMNNTNPVSTQTLVLFAELLGLLTREMAIQYLPTAGIYFAGSASRGIFGAGVSTAFEYGAFGQKHFLKDINQIPIGLITDDAAGLLGCSQRALSC